MVKTRDREKTAQEQEEKSLLDIQKHGHYARNGPQPPYAQTWQEQISWAAIKKIDSRVQKH